VKIYVPSVPVWPGFKLMMLVTNKIDTRSKPYKLSCCQKHSAIIKIIASTWLFLIFFFNDNYA